MVTINIVNSNQCKLEGPLRTLTWLFNKYKIRHPNAWHIMQYQGRNSRYQWDGYVKYISEKGTFRLGLLPSIYRDLKEYGEKVTIKDYRVPLMINPDIPKTLGNMKLYPRQIKALETLLNNKIGGIPFLISVGDYSVGFGKSLLFCAIHEAFHRQIPSILLLNDSDLFNQFKREIPPMLPGEDVKFIQGSKVSSWGRFNVAMVQSISRNIQKYQYELAKIGIVLIDEADLIDNKTYKTVIEHLYNTQIRIGLSGTIYMKDTAKEKIHNMNIRSYIGDKIDQVKLSDQIKSKMATPVVIKMIYTGIGCDQGRGLTYLEEYKETISNNEEAYKCSLWRTLYNAHYNRFPMLIVTKFIEHCENLYKFYVQELNRLGFKYTIAYCHHETKNRDKILQDFREGKIDILIATTIISRGKNFPMLKYLQNTASMDSNERSIQILGRLVRQHSSETKAYLDDLIFEGHYLRRHGNHRKIYYQKEKLKVLKIINKH